MLRTAVLAAALLIAPPALAQASPPANPFPHVTDASITEPDGDRVLQLWIDVPATPDAVWRTWTTAEGWKSFAVRHALVDFRVGGRIETSYAESFTPGSAANIVNEVIAYVPGRMLTIRNVQAPPGFEHAAEFARTVTTIEMFAVDGGTRVVVTGTGFVPGPAYDTLFQRFKAGNSWTLEKLRERLAAR